MTGVEAGDEPVPGLDHLVRRCVALGDGFVDRIAEERQQRISADQGDEGEREQDQAQGIVLPAGGQVHLPPGVRDGDDRDAADVHHDSPDHAGDEHGQGVKQRPIPPDDVDRPGGDHGHHADDPAAGLVDEELFVGQFEHRAGHEVIDAEDIEDLAAEHRTDLLQADDEPLVELQRHGDE